MGADFDFFRDIKKMSGNDISRIFHEPFWPLR